MSGAGTEVSTGPRPSNQVAERPVAPVRGTRDWLPGDHARLAGLERTLLDQFRRAGYQPMRTPILEFSELHERKSGAGIVAKHLKSAGAEVTFSTVLGDDALAEFALKDLESAGVHTTRHGSAAAAMDTVIGAGDAGDGVKENENVFARFDHSTAALDHEAGEAHVGFEVLVVG